MNIKKKVLLFFTVACMLSGQTFAVAPESWNTAKWHVSGTIGDIYSDGQWGDYTIWFDIVPDPNAYNGGTWAGSGPGAGVPPTTTGNTQACMGSTADASTARRFQITNTGESYPDNLTWYSVKKQRQDLQMSMLIQAKAMGAKVTASIGTDFCKLWDLRVLN